MHCHTLMNDLKCWLEFCKFEFKFLLMLSVDESATIRVTNLSEDTRESDLQELFRPFGPIQRIYLAKDKNTGQSKVCQLICNWCIRTLKTKNSLNYFCMVCIFFLIPLTFHMLCRDLPLSTSTEGKMLQELLLVCLVLDMIISFLMWNGPSKSDFFVNNLLC